MLKETEDACRAPGGWGQTGAELARQAAPRERKEAQDHHVDSGFIPAILGKHSGFWVMI